MTSRKKDRTPLRKGAILFFISLVYNILFLVWKPDSMDWIIALYVVVTGFSQYVMLSWEAGTRSLQKHIFAALFLRLIVPLLLLGIIYLLAESFPMLIFSACLYPVVYCLVFRRVFYWMYPRKVKYKEDTRRSIRVLCLSFFFLALAASMYSCVDFPLGKHYKDMIGSPHVTWMLPLVLRRSQIFFTATLFLLSLILRKTSLGRNAAHTAEPIELPTTKTKKIDWFSFKIKVIAAILLAALLLALQQISIQASLVIARIYPAMLLFITCVWERPVRWRDAVLSAVGAAALGAILQMALGPILMSLLGGGSFAYPVAGLLISVYYICMQYLLLRGWYGWKQVVIKPKYIGMVLVVLGMLLLYLYSEFAFGAWEDFGWIHAADDQASLKEYFDLRNNNPYKISVMLSSMITLNLQMLFWPFILRDANLPNETESTSNEDDAAPVQE